MAVLRACMLMMRKPRSRATFQQNSSWWRQCLFPGGYFERPLAKAAGLWVFLCDEAAGQNFLVVECPDQDIFFFLFQFISEKINPNGFLRISKRRSTIFW
jgi:hypothetical protein